MNIVLALFLILVFSIALAKSTDLVIANIVKLARRLAVPEFTVGFFILGFATSLPEIFVAVNAVMEKTPQLSLGNLLGAILVLLTLIISLPAVLSGGVEIRKVLSSKDIVLSSFVIALPAFFSLDGNLTRLDGAILLFSYLIYVYVLNEDRSFLEKIKSAARKNKGNLFKVMALTSLGVLGIFIFSRFIVEISLDVAQTFFVPPLLVGVLFLSLGTNLPELSLAVKTVISKHKIVGIGDFLGSAAVNTFVVALLCLIYPFKVDDLAGVRKASLFVIAAVILLAIFMRTKRQLTRKEGIMLLSLYAVFLLVEISSI
ncbi:hypothetical protein COT69_00590 [candidate division WWE3 bacterium CG09_land_8_20_14_0_10_39_24]|uniref:Sodium/calcium exchanger membrane region domain-containing protein n=1 Tax=candidate division WWE3 bacterium CG09_land_8_20_14_0_10_39_24 TaxID=1975088 RepID=A0A2H0WMB0_UNCKA|nr:MAG: hypothetical protein BK003_00575 [bacterium CG09_39_24]PIS13078.1 MAG: hypothetical protein COT69_00590 [candidate division WWE3 bacterium CG09_land_8_20_14_0_10_39_24]